MDVHNPGTWPFRARIYVYLHEKGSYAPPYNFGQEICKKEPNIFGYSFMYPGAFYVSQPDYFLLECYSLLTREQNDYYTVSPLIILMLDCSIY